MRVHEVVQGSPEWLALRSGHDTASEAPAMMGVSKFQSRSDLLRQKHTGIAQAVNEQKQSLFDRGHDAEAASRPEAETIIGGELYPITATEVVDGLALLASMDGATIDGETLWEHKLWSESLAAAVRAVNLPEQYTVQMDQQLLVTGAKRVLFMVSDGDERMEWCWYTSTPEKQHALIAGWHQFHADLAAYTPPAEVPAPVKAAVTTLPAVSVRVDGALAVRHNFDVLETRMREFIDGLPKEPQSDDDFGVAEAAVKTLETAEGAIKAAIDGAVAQSASLEEVVRIGRGLQERARTTRLALDKLVKARKDTIRAEIVGAAALALGAHVTMLNERLGGPWVQLPPVGVFAEAIKGKKTVVSVRAACDQALANEKIAANEMAERLGANRKALIREGQDFIFLFADFAAAGQQATETFAAIVEQRIRQHAQVQQAHENLLERQAQVVAASSAYRERHESTDSAPTLRLGQICDRLGMGITESFLAGIGFPAAGRDKAAKLYHEHDFQRMCAAIAEHVMAVAEMKR